jgi:hypothetical protein
MIVCHCNWYPVIASCRFICTVQTCPIGLPYALQSKGAIGRSERLERFGIRTFRHKFALEMPQNVSIPKRSGRSERPDRPDWTILHCTNESATSNNCVWYFFLIRNDRALDSSHIRSSQPCFATALRVRYGAQKRYSCQGSGCDTGQVQRHRRDNLSSTCNWFTCNDCQNAMSEYKLAAIHTAQAAGNS